MRPERYTAVQSTGAIFGLTRLTATLLSLTIFGSGAAASEPLTLLEFDVATLERSITLTDAHQLDEKAGDGRMLVRTGTTKPWPGVTLVPGDSQAWNLSDRAAIETDIANLDQEPLVVHLRIDNPAGTGGRVTPWITTKTTVPGGETVRLHAKLRRAGRVKPPLSGMLAYPQGVDTEGVDAARVSRILIFVARSEKERTFSIGPVQAVGEYRAQPWERMTGEQFYPFIDAYGQFRHADWPGKVQEERTLGAQLADEAQALADYPGPGERDQYGGWKSGPRLTASGRFRVAQHEGNWWLVDPDGYLFWSHGIGVVRPSAPTIVSGRERYFDTRVASGKPGEPFYAAIPAPGEGGRDGATVLTYDFAEANLSQKYGTDWEDDIVSTILKRLPSWGINTLGLWSADEIKARKAIPYTEWLYYKSPGIAGSYKTGKSLVDMWHPLFEERLRAAAAKLDELKDDAWLIGVFVDNELAWRDPVTFLISVLRSPAEQPAKRILIDHLRDGHGEIQALNSAWGTRYASWDQVLQKTDLPDQGRVSAAAKTYMALSAEHYYKTVAAIIAEKAPKLLYLCSRFNGRFPIPERAAAKYCDIVSYNLYRTSVRDFAPVDDLDVPVLVSEWHFGATDRGLFGAGLVAVPDQRERAASYSAYATGAVSNPRIVGAHWFQYLDEPVSGRPLDGENYQIGFVTVTDYPYPEIVSASRAIGEKLYRLR